MHRSTSSLRLASMKSRLFGFNALAAAVSLWFFAGATTLPRLSAAKEPATKPTKNYTRIVSIGNSTTEILYALGAQEQLVAVDTTSLYPKDALKRLPNVGYMRKLSAEPILSLNPDLIVTDEGAKPPVVLEQLQETGVDVVKVPDIPTLEGVAQKIQLIGNAIHRSAEARVLVAKMEAERRELKEFLSKFTQRPKVLFLFTVRSGAVVAAGAGTSAHSLLTYAQGANIFSHLEGYKPVTTEAIISAAPEVIVVPSHSVERLGGLDEVLAAPGIRLTPAVKNGRVLVMDSTLALGYGPRLPQAIRQLAEYIHNER